MTALSSFTCSCSILATCLQHGLHAPTASPSSRKPKPLFTPAMNYVCSTILCHLSQSAHATMILELTAGYNVLQSSSKPPTLCQCAYVPRISLARSHNAFRKSSDEWSGISSDRNEWYLPAIVSPPPAYPGCDTAQDPLPANQPSPAPGRCRS